MYFFLQDLFYFSYLWSLLNLTSFISVFPETSTDIDSKEHLVTIELDWNVEMQVPFPT